MKRLLVILLAVTFSFNSLVMVPAQAALVATGDVIEQDTSLASDRDRLNSMMQRQDVREELRRQGVDPDEAAARVAALSDREIAQVSDQIDQLPAGEGGLGFVLAAIGIIVIILVLTDIFCVTNIFNFTRCTVD